MLTAVWFTMLTIATDMPTRWAYRWKNMKKPMMERPRRVEQRSGVGWTRPASSSFFTSISATSNNHAVTSMGLMAVILSRCVLITLSTLQVRHEATPSKCMPPPLQHSHICIHMTLTFDLENLFSSAHTHAMICGKFHWNPSTKYWDIVSCETGGNRRATDGLTDDFAAFFINIALSYGVHIFTDNYFVLSHNSRIWQTDRRTDGQMSTARPCVCIRRRAVKTDRRSTLRTWNRESANAQRGQRRRESGIVSSLRRPSICTIAVTWKEITQISNLHQFCVHCVCRNSENVGNLSKVHLWPILVIHIHNTDRYW